MRIPIAFTLILAAAAAGLAWHGHQRLATASENHTRLISAAAARGISLDSKLGMIVPKHLRETREAQIKRLLDDYVSLHKEAKAKGTLSSRKPDKDTQERSGKIMRGIMALDAEGMGKLIEAVLACKELDETPRRTFSNHIAMILGQQHPIKFLALLARSPELIGNSEDMEYHVRNSLSILAKEDPTRAVEWIRTNGKRFPQLVEDNAKVGVIFHAAKEDPKTAFALVGELGLDIPRNAVENIALAAKDSEHRTSTLAALREYLATITDTKVRQEMASAALDHLARSASEEGFEAGSKWLVQAGFSTEELGQMAEGVHWNWVKHDEIGRWIVWLGDTVPGAKGGESIRTIVQFWTQEDHQAAGTWLTTAPEGSGKTAAVRAFAEAVAKVDPQTAAQWAMTLPSGSPRDSLLKRIHDNWPEKDDAAKEAFAKQHGIEE